MSELKKKYLLESELIEKVNDNYLNLQLRKISNETYRAMFNCHYIKSYTLNWALESLLKNILLSSDHVKQRGIGTNPNGLLQQTLYVMHMSHSNTICSTCSIFVLTEYWIHLSRQSLTSKPLWILLHEHKASEFHLLNKNLDNCKKTSHS